MFKDSGAERMDNINNKTFIKCQLCQNTYNICQFSSVQSLSHVQFFVTSWTTARQASLSITNSCSLLKLMSIELVMPSNHQQRKGSSVDPFSSCL